MAASATSTALTENIGHSTPRRPNVTLAVIVGVELLLMLDMTVLNIALPSIRSDLGFSSSGLAWVVNAFALTFGGLLLLGGRAGDLLGRRRVFIVGVAVFTLASLAGGLAGSPGMLIAARVLQGIGAAFAGPSTLALLMTHFAQGERRNRALAVYSTVTGSAMVLGLILGGAVIHLSDWRWVLLMNVPIGLVVAVLAPFTLTEGPRIRGHFDLAGALTSTLGLGGLVYGLLRAAEGAWLDPLTIGCVLGGLLLLGLFVVIERRATQPIMPLRMFADRSRAAAFLNMLLIPATLFAMFFFLVRYLQEVLGHSPLLTGVSFLPMALSVMLGTRVVSSLVPRLGPKPIAALGALMITAAAMGLAALGPGSDYLTGMLGPMILFGAGVGFSVVPLNIIIVAGVPAEDSGAASGMLQAFQQIGGALGLAILVTVFGAVSRSAAATGADTAIVMTEAVTSAFLIGSAFSFGALVTTLACVDGDRSRTGAAAAE